MGAKDDRQIDRQTSRTAMKCDGKRGREVAGNKKEWKVKEGGRLTNQTKLSSKSTPSNKQQGPTVQHRELYSISCDKPQ